LVIGCAKVNGEGNLDVEMVEERVGLEAAEELGSGGEGVWCPEITGNGGPWSRTQMRLA
jgi:hypothetical protein